MTDSTRDAALRALDDPTTPAEALMAIVSDHPDLGWQAARDPNAYPDLVDWVSRYAPPEAPALYGIPPAEPGADAPPAPLPFGVPDAQYPADWPTEDDGDAEPRPRRRGLFVAALIAIAVLVGGGVVGGTALWVKANEKPAPTSGAHAEGADAPATGEPTGDGSDASGTGGTGSGTDQDPPSPATPDDHEEEFRAAAQENGFPVEMQGQWCPAEPNESGAECFDVDSWLAEYPDGFVSGEQAIGAYYTVGGETMFNLCITRSNGDSCITAEQMTFTYYPAGVESSVCDQAVADGYSDCLPGYEADTTRDRLVLAVSHQHDEAFHEGTLMYRE